MTAQQSAVIARLQKHAEKAQTDLKSVSYLRWNDLDHGNWLLFDLTDGYSHEAVNDDGYKFPRWKTPAVYLCDDGGNCIKHIIVGEDSKDDQFIEVPGKEKWFKEYQQKLDEGFVTCYMTGHELVEDWTPKGKSTSISFHKTTRLYYREDDLETQLLWEETKGTILK